MNRIDFYNAFIIVFLAGTIVSFLINQFLEWIDFRERCRSGGEIPSVLKNIPESSCFDFEKLRKICAYKNAKYFAWIPSSVLGTALSLALVCTGFYPWLFNVVCRITGTPGSFVSSYTCAFLFMVFCSIPESILSIPFDLYREFRIEKKFGFSNMTFRLWILDGIKNLIVSLVMSAVLIAAMITVLTGFPKLWWIFITCILFAFTLIMQILYPLVIAPLFNKFIPLEDGELKSRITSLMEQLGFKSTGIFVVDASKRSGHSNAYFTGIGKSKRVVLYDTLVEQLTTDELVAVLGHEFGHYKLHHIVRRICIMLPVEFLLMFLLYVFSQTTALYTGFGFAVAQTQVQSVQFIGLFLSSLVAGSVQEILSPLMHFGSRRDEYAADAFSARLTKNPHALVTALIKLNSENLSELLPAKLYVIWNYSHPALSERVAALEALAENG